MKIRDIPVGTYIIDTVYDHRGFVRSNVRSKNGDYLTVYSEITACIVGYHQTHIDQIVAASDSCILVPRNVKRER